jgi:gamma-glutamylaminecyclotransferase
MPVRLFVYGTLQRGEPAHRLLEAARFVGAARTAPGFELVDFGDYPALARGGGGQIAGELYEVMAEVLVAIDVYEGCPDLYVRERIELSDGSQAEAYLLASPDQACGLPRIPSGDWRSGSDRIRS